MPHLRPIGSVGPMLRRAVEFMRENLERPLSLDDIAEAVERSPSQLARQFRAGLGTPPHQYLLVLRIKHAQQLLRETVQPIAEIAVASGFSHQEHMTRMFRRLGDTTPAAYRRAFQN